MKKYNDESEFEKDWSIKKLIKYYHQANTLFNSDISFKTSVLYDLEMLENELKNRGYEIILQPPKIKKLQ